MGTYMLGGSTRRGVWKRRLTIIFGGLFAILWLLILPLPGPMARARHHLLTEGAANPANQQTKANRAPRFYDSARGVVNSSGPAGNWKIQVNSCASGQHRGFYGVSLSESEHPNPAMNIVLPEDGASHLTVKNPAGILDVIPKEQCSVWDVFIDEDGTVANEIYELSGHAQFDCKSLRTGEHVTGDVTLKSCH